MGAATVAAEIARLDAVSRTRALDDGESCQLEKLVRMERRYAAMKASREQAKRARPPRPKRPPPRPDPPVVRIAAADFVDRRVRFAPDPEQPGHVIEARGLRARGKGDGAWLDTIDAAGVIRGVRPSRCILVLG